MFSQHLTTSEDPPLDLHITKWQKKQLFPQSGSPVWAATDSGCSECVAVRAGADSLTPCFTAFIYMLSLQAGTTSPTSPTQSVPLPAGLLGLSEVHSTGGTLCEKAQGSSRGKRPSSPCQPYVLLPLLVTEVLNMNVPRCSEKELTWADGDRSREGRERCPPDTEAWAGSLTSEEENPTQLFSCHLADRGCASSCGLVSLRGYDSTFRCTGAVLCHVSSGSESGRQ